MKNLTTKRAKSLARALSGRDGMDKSVGCVRVHVDEHADRIVFEHVEYKRSEHVGWTFGKTLSSHSLCISASTEARVVAHYDGFCENLGLSVNEGGSCMFPSGSARSGWRAGKVLKVTGRRIKVRGRFNYGAIFETFVSKGDVRALG